MTPDTELVAITAASLKVIEALYGECFDEAWVAADIAKIMAMPGAFGFMAMAPGTADGQPEGFLLGWCAAGEGEIISVGVRPPARRRGIGAHLVAAALSHAKSLDVRRLALEVAEDNAAAVGLYRRQGFAIAGSRPNYYRTKAGEPRHAHIMTIEIAQ